jgi:hypothetical protein
MAARLLPKIITASDNEVNISRLFFQINLSQKTLNLLTLIIRN